MCINNTCSVFNNIANSSVHLNVDGDDISAVPSITVYNSTLNNATLVIIINDDNKKSTPTLTHFILSSLSVVLVVANTYHGLLCKGMDYLLPTISIFSCNFVNNQMSAVKAEYCKIVLQKNCSFVTCFAKTSHLRTPCQITVFTVNG